ncbi:MAG: hypothetical protein K2X81_25335, partial [Candidatus Obscuribacterales bacterium]|nr:hypothetical protein [Candidatus Obscuribacterales bacterium]
SDYTLFIGIGTGWRFLEMDYDHHDLPREAQHIARELDNGDVREASHHLREDLYQMQNNPRAQRELLQMVDRFENKGQGADLQIQYGYEGRVSWNITSPYPQPYEQAPQPYYPQQAQPQPQPYYRQPDVVVVPQRPDPGDQLLNGLGLGIGVGVGAAITRGIFGGGHERYLR